MFISLVGLRRFQSPSESGVAVADRLKHEAIWAVPEGCVVAGVVLRKLLWGMDDLITARRYPPVDTIDCSSRFSL